MGDGNRDPESASLQELTVWCDDAEAAAPLVTALRQRFAVDLRDSLPALEARLGDLPAGGILLLYLSPVETLCRAMAAQTPPSAALAAWQSRAEDILGLNRRARRRIRLLEIGAGRSSPDVFRRHFDLPEAALSALPPQDQLLRLMAHQVISGDLQARSLQGELEAASLDCAGGKQTAGDLDAAFNAYQDMSRAQQKAGLLQAQACLAQEEWSRLAAQKQALETAAATAEKDRQRIQEDATLLKAQNRELQDKFETAARRRRELESGLETARQDGQKIQRDATLLKAQNRELQGKLETAARRRRELESSLETAKQDGQKAQKDGEVLRAQVHLMKQEAKTLLADRERLEQRLAQMNQGMESYQAQISALSAERHRLGRRAREKEHSLQAAAAGMRDAEMQRDYLIARLDEVLAERESALREAKAKETAIQRILSSRSFRLMAPFRRLHALFSNGGAA